VTGTGFNGEFNGAAVERAEQRPAQSKVAVTRPVSNRFAPERILLNPFVIFTSHFCTGIIVVGPQSRLQIYMLLRKLAGLFRK
jgi:hypothetical protein